MASPWLMNGGDPPRYTPFFPNIEPENPCYGKGEPSTQTTNFWVPAVSFPTAKVQPLCQSRRLPAMVPSRAAPRRLGSDRHPSVVVVHSRCKVAGDLGAESLWQVVLSSSCFLFLFGGTDILTWFVCWSWFFFSSRHFFLGGRRHTVMVVGGFVSSKSKGTPTVVCSVGHFKWGVYP